MLRRLHDVTFDDDVVKIQSIPLSDDFCRNALSDVRRQSGEVQLLVMLATPTTVSVLHCLLIAETQMPNYAVRPALA